MSKTQTDEVVAHLMLKTYRCSYEIIEYIWKTHEIRFSISGLNKWLHQHNFSYKQPKGIPHKFDEEKQDDFIKRYTELKAQVVDEPILFMDAMHPTQATKLSCGWIKKGHDKLIETTGSRTRLNLVGAIDLNNVAAAQVKRYEKVNSETIQHFFSELRTHNGCDKRLHLIFDGAGYHRAQVLKVKRMSLILNCIIFRLTVQV